MELEEVPWPGCYPLALGRRCVIHRVRSGLDEFMDGQQRATEQPSMFPEWRDAATAPRNGRTIIVAWIAPDALLFVQAVSFREGRWQAAGSKRAVDADFNAWVPLPLAIVDRAKLS